METFFYEYSISIAELFKAVLSINFFYCDMIKTNRFVLVPTALLHVG